MVPCPDVELLEACKAECVAPEFASAALDHKSSSRTSPALDVWSLGVMILKVFASGKMLIEFQDCAKPRDIFELLDETGTDGELSSTCYFERSIAAFVSNEDMKDLLRQCFRRNPLSRPSVGNILKHKAFQVKEREVSRRTRVKSSKISQELSAIVEEQGILKATDEPERKTNGKDQQTCEVQDNQLEDVSPEPFPPSLWLFLPPQELELDLNQGASFYSMDQWVSKLKHLQQQRAEEIRFPLVFMCEVCDSNTAVPCNITKTTKFGASVPSSLLPLVMPLVRETMLFLEARAILFNGLSVGEASGLAGPQQWKELRTFYSALEHMELATVNPVNEVMFAPMELQLQSQDPSKAQQVLNELKGLVFSEEKREYVRNLLNALVSDEKLEAQVERNSWASLRRCDVTREIVAEVATFHDVFGVLGIPTIVVLVLSAVWTFMLAVIQVHADMMANTIMNTTEFDNGEFWLLPQPDTALVVSSVVLLSLFGIGYAGLAVIMTAVLDLPKLIFQTITLFTYLQGGFPTAIIYYYSVLLLCNWLMACYRSQRYVADPDLIIARLYYAFDLFFAVFAPLVVLIYFIDSFEFDRGAFMTRLETIGVGTFDTVARIFGDPSEISSFCNAFHYLQFSSGSTLFYKSALNVLSLYKWRKIILTLIHNHHERQAERNRKALVEPAWNFGYEHCTCLVFADRQIKPTTYTEWIDPVDTTANLAELSIAGELRIVQIINRAVPELPEELRKCHKLEQLILAYTKTELLPEWISEFSNLQYL
ncbi:hypothetical protein BBO99_00001925 [Phytophthora kernoviae]|uniref:Protein kinase domain-containing protein n=2 Tax=Phytophthora kernoviae TaxID=325452 RepID=A0A421FCF0_9STRA|nr:hypothetical protein G195_004279 [Phytophthora kernoviae 00238/432]KAG2526350.1 hypothetical protein JM16_003903 [Phytophthora kernoviae]KAG2527475.1 hypothetical protein JM18_003769 [Phytophthora kernoviae]RLN37497.1 hypothetical protein BBI17_001827 [Phytophthora kernoviae]RLN83610.1 hypothetical protein BBO99_00001925 [Phytophthora kernoviae]